VFDSSFDEPLLGSLYARHGEELARYAARFTGDPDLAADVVQETFLRLTRRPPNDLLAVRPWLFRVATTIALDMMRVHRRRATLTAAHAGRLPVADATPDPAEFAEREDLRRRVREVLEQMDPRDRAVLLMREEGFAHHEIAEAVGTTTKSVGTMIARALVRLAKRLNFDGADT
jgi:RNA polymerase sigma-70 factor (ECF subfamily)